uniref:Chloride channel CLIC-like protein 1 n=1 Tax=Anopheles maculatus TaxID=74869 RepID=A0A182S8U7_9DIPT
RHRHDSKWIKPGALDRWGQQQQQQQRLRTQPTDGSCDVQTELVQCDCPPPPPEPEPIPCSVDISEDQRLALIFYRKLIKTLFARDTLEVDAAGEEDYHTADLQLKISTRQLDKLLDDSCTAREINLIVSAVLEKSANARRSSLRRENQCERLYNFLMQCFESNILHNLLPVVLLIAICYLVRIIARIVRMNSFIVLLLLIFSINFCNKWKECNEELAKKSLQNLEEKLPRSTMMSHVFGIGSRTEDSVLPVCDPLHVLLQSTASLQAVYFKSILKELLDAFKESTQNAGWFQTFTIGLLMLGFSYVVLSSLLTVGISSGFKMVGTVISTGLTSSGNRQAIDNTTQQQQQQQLPAVNLNIHIGDGISRTVQLNELLRQDSQRIEVVSEEPTAVQAIGESPEEKDTTKVVDVPAVTTTSEKVVELNDTTVANNQTNEED